MLKVGSKVRVKRNLKSGNHYSYHPLWHGTSSMYFNEEMEKFKGKIVTIVEYMDGDDIYIIKEDNQEWAWVESMFETMDNSYTIEIIRKRGK